MWLGQIENVEAGGYGVLECAMDLVAGCAVLNPAVVCSPSLSMYIPACPNSTFLLAQTESLAQLVDTLLDASPHTRRTKEKTAFLLDPRRRLLSSHLSLLMGILILVDINLLLRTSLRESSSSSSCKVPICLS